MSKQRLKQVASAAVIVASLVFAVYYWRSHPQITDQLKSVSPWTALSLVLLYGVMTVVLVLLYRLMLHICKAKISFKENALLTMYSTIVNFFGPLQSGPGFRTVYLKKKHNVSIKAYASVTLLYYGLFGVCNLVFLAFGIIPLRFAPLVAIAVALLAWSIWKVLPKLPYVSRYKEQMDGRLFAQLALTTLAQALLVIIIYFIELHSVGAHVSLSQAIVYTGAANLALFVSLTPGALGFRESFLYLSQRLHHIPGDTIIAANVLDRAVYVVYLGVLFVLILALHAKGRLKLPENK